ncbi:acetylxylan esterase [Leifsonia poae]|uniref:acetylxylan esterase n=1 Tax=Leifsonia poae TaxID=110933 RepID=UPI003D66E08D
MFTDIAESELRDYAGSQVDPDDFDEFWADTLSESRALPLDVVVEPVASPLSTVDVFDVTFFGYRGQPVKAWLRLPAAAEAPLPALVQFVGYGGGRGHALENLLWASAGFAHFQMDTRGQGSSWSSGDTPDPEGSAPAFPGFMTRGIESRETYYYRRVIVDAVRAVEAARSLPAIDASRVSVLGFSQGGGLALAVAGLIPDLRAAFPFVPFLCDFPRATTITDNDPYHEIVRYLAIHRGKTAAALETLQYFDGVNFAKRASSPGYFSTALMDPTCPPSTVFAAYNSYAAAKEITVWPYNAHEGGALQDELKALEVLLER